MGHLARAALLVAPLLDSASGHAAVFEIGSLRVEAGTRARFALPLSEGYAGVPITTPVEVLNGVVRGPVLCLTGGVHGDEINGVEIVRRVHEGLDARSLQATVVAVPIVNVPAFRLGSRYLPDRRDLNRAFPGDPDGSMAGRIAHRLMEDVVRHCDALVDVHSGSNRRSNLPQVRADMRDARTATLAHALAPLPVLHKIPGDGTLRRAAAERGTVSVVIEVGEANRLDARGIDEAVEAVTGMIRLYRSGNASCHAHGVADRSGCERHSYYRSSTWLRADSGGIFTSDSRLGDRVAPGQLLGVVVDPANGQRSPVPATRPGIVIGRAAGQLVMPGFAVLHIATDETPSSVTP